MFYLKKFFDNKGIHDYLINQLYTYSEQDIEFYLPQIWFSNFFEFHWNFFL